MPKKETQEKQAVKFTEAELALIDQGIAEIARGEGMTFEQARELARKRSKQWMATSQQSAAV